MSHLRIVLLVRKDNQLFNKFIKCEYWFILVAFLGYIVSSERVEVDPNKMEMVKFLPRHLNTTNIRSFLCLVGYYRMIVE